MSLFRCPVICFFTFAKRSDVTINHENGKSMRKVETLAGLFGVQQSTHGACITNAHPQSQPEATWHPASHPPNQSLLQHESLPAFPKSTQVHHLSAPYLSCELSRSCMWLSVTHLRREVRGGKKIGPSAKLEQRGGNRSPWKKKPVSSAHRNRKEKKKGQSWLREQKAQRTKRNCGRKLRQGKASAQITGQEMQVQGISETCPLQQSGAGLWKTP